MNKNILIINSYAGSPSYGMTFRHYYLAKEFIKRDCKVTIASASYSHFLTKYPDMDGGRFKKESIDGIDFVWIKVIRYGVSFSKKRVLKWFEFTLKLFFLSKYLNNKPDYIICSTTELFGILPAYFLSKKYKAKLIFEVRDIWPLTLIELGGISRFHPLVKIMSYFEKFSIEKSDIIVSNLSNYSKYLNFLGYFDKASFWIPNGVNADEMNFDQALPCDIVDRIPRDKFIVGYAGKLGVSNSLKYLLEAAKILNNVDDIFFVIVGDGQEKDKLKKISEKSSNVLFVDSIPKPQVQSMLKFFDICFLGWKNKDIYRYGTSANKIFDYMYSGKPVLQSINIENDVVEKSKCGICVEAENPCAISEGILKFYNMSPLERGAMGENGRRHVLENFTYSSLSEKYLAVLQNSCNC